jgi:hypothetical protein
MPNGHVCVHRATLPHALCFTRSAAHKRYERNFSQLFPFDTQADQAGYLQESSRQGTTNQCPQCHLAVQ